MENKEVVEILMKYFKKQPNTDDLLRVLANLMIDCGRIVNFSHYLMWIGSPSGDLSGSIEYEKFLRRMKLNIDEVVKVINNADDAKGFSFSQYEE